MGPFEALESDEGGMNAHLARLMGRAGSRQNDMFWQGDADEGVWQLCREMGWEDELKEMIRIGRAELERKWGVAEDSPAVAGASKGVSTTQRDGGTREEASRSGNSIDDDGADDGREDAEEGGSEHAGRQRDVVNSTAADDGVKPSQSGIDESDAVARAQKESGGVGESGAVDKSDAAESDGLDDLNEALEKDLKLSS